MPVFDAAVSSIITGTAIEDIIYYAQAALDTATTIDHMITQIQQGVEMAERTMQNMASAKDIRSLSDFQDWYNRQLTYENMTMDTFKNMNVKIGNKNVSMWDLEAIADGTREAFDLSKGMTEEQRREMWLKLGLTPANYAYRQAFQANEMATLKRMFAARNIEGEDAAKDDKRDAELQAKLEADALKLTEESMGDKEIQQYILETLIRNGVSQRRANLILSDIAQKMASDEYLDKTPVSTPFLSDWSDENGWDIK